MTERGTRPVRHTVHTSIVGSTTNTASAVLSVYTSLSWKVDGGDFEMEVVDCLLCGSPDRRVFMHGRDLMCGVPGEFTLVECARCGFLYLSPRPDEAEIVRYYPDSYAFYSTPDVNQTSTWRKRTVRDDLERRCRAVNERVPTGDLLDIGAASGQFIFAMREHGWNVRGLEPSETGVERARAAFGVTMDQGTLETVDYPAESFDAVTMWEVLEHVRRPKETLEQIGHILRPGGFLIMSMPNRDALDAKIFRRGWIGYDVPRHFSVFSRSQIVQAVVDTGFERPDIFAPAGNLGAVHMGLVCFLSSLAMSMRDRVFRSEDGERRVATVMTILGRPILIVLLFLVLLPYSWMARALNRGTTMVVVARKGTAS